jgi:phosphatidylinositol alpha-1,6-mannosyltransferase
MLSSERYKGHDELLDAWPRVVAAVPHAQLVIVGQGDDSTRLREKAMRTPARDSIVFTGFVSEAELAALYEHAALFALPSRAEGFGLVYLEAMAHRLPCIGSIHDAARDVIVDGCTGRLVDQTNIDTLSEALIDLLCDDGRRRRMGEAGYRRLQEQFTFESFAARMDSLLNDAAARPPVSRNGS